MVSIKQTTIYPDVIKELNYSFGDVFIFDGYVVSEIKQGVHFSWKHHAKQIVKDMSCFLGTDGSDLIYISNRINPYSVVAIDWLKFFKKQYFLKCYYIVNDNKISLMNVMIEELFFKNKIKNFDSIYSAINWTKKGGEIVA